MIDFDLDLRLCDAVDSAELGRRNALDNVRALLNVRIRSRDHALIEAALARAVEAYAACHRAQAALDEEVTRGKTQ